jgi:hypothetical protein
MTRELTPELADQIRNVAAMVSSTLDDEPIWDEAFDGLLEDMRAADDVQIYGAFSGLVVFLLNRMAKLTGIPREELWRELAEGIATRVTTE